MFAKMVLPLLGGSPAVWNTAMMFFQAVLLAGYGYAHLSSRLLGPRPQVIVHVLIMALAFAVLPIGVAAGWTPPTEHTPVLWLIGLFAVSVGIPFFAVSTNAPLLQRWFSHTRHPAASDPYFLYGASNVGSILALLGYPVVVEPLLRLDQQSLAWALGYGLLFVLLIASGLLLWRTGAPRAAATLPPEGMPGAITWRRRLHWVVLAFAPSSLLLGVTAHITTDVAAVPLLWVVPLTLFLLTFVLVFARRPPIPHGWMVRAQPFLVIIVAIFYFWPIFPIWLFNAGLHLATFFVTAMVCHGELVKRRPRAEDLTAFYLWMAFGGMLGGVFNALVAPVVFDSVLEYPIVLVLACMLRPRPDAEGPRDRIWDGVIPGALLALFLIAATMLELRLSDLEVWGLLAVCIPMGLVLYSFRARPERFGAGIAATFVATAITGAFSDVIDRERSFFGVHKVQIVEEDEERFHLLLHGTTLHGVQHVARERWRTPLSYFSEAGPFGQMFTALERVRPPKTVAIIGLGAVALACYRRPGQVWTFYEIDPVVLKLARDERYFHYLAECAPEQRVVLGDARLSLVDAPDGHYDVLIQDAFSSDSIPIHLITREALALYMEKLARGGLIMFQITNRHLDLAPVLARLAMDAGLVTRLQRYRLKKEGPLGNSADVVVVARRAEDLAFLDGDSRWQAIEIADGVGVWTDDFSNILGVLK